MSAAEMQRDIAERVADLAADDAARFRRTVEFIIATAADVDAAAPADRAALYREAISKGAALGIEVQHLPQYYNAETAAFLRGLCHVARHAELVTRGAPTSH